MSESDNPARGIIVAMTADGVIGLNDTLPWHYSADLKRFRRLTLGTTVIMGRVTWESIGARPLPGRRNIVITRRPIEGVDTFSDLSAAADAADSPLWFIGGAGIYRDALALADLIDVTLVPDSVSDPAAVRFPAIDPARWRLSEEQTLEGDPRLRNRRYVRRDNT